MSKNHPSPGTFPARSFALIAAGLMAVALIGVTFAWPGVAERAESNSTDGSIPSSDEEKNALSIHQRVQQLESTLERTLKIQGQLLELVNELNSKVDPTSEDQSTRHVSATPPPREHRQQHHNRAVDRFQRQREHQIRTLTEAGFSHERASFIVDRQERVYYEQMQLSYQYRYLEDKTSQEARDLQEKIHTHSNPRRVLEQELSSEEFDRYLEAYGGRTEFQIGDLLEAAPAYQAGLRPGDKIIRYNNQRVFHMGDLRSQVYQVAPGENVAVEIQRDGSSSTETIYIPAGPLGIRG
ncbi:MULTISPECIES: PDZ domain-containing protein [Microbulbifer]|uniref:PDZ domain-containing protein n=1 Tax=Microbulbifer celer TaxID=435905 RepID=A0ABW3U5V2_9GAMM|nr:MULTISPECIES: PDZ domain-containing protein [Microbulbifer]UFN58421.1 PDZ domain-containing protein [Microbulbifer celer]